METQHTESQPVEMADLGAQNTALDPLQATSSSDAPPADLKTMKENQKPESSSFPVPSWPLIDNVVPGSQQLPIGDPSTSSDANQSPPETFKRQQTALAIGAASEEMPPMPEQPEIAAATLLITLLLHTGARHPYKIDEKYLKKRNVNVTDNNPINMSVYTLKELIWRDWREEWEPRPASPTSIRLIHFGKLLDDKSHLKDGRFSIGDAPNVVHMSVKPQEVVDDEDARIAKG
ncbi:MAG: hypothetical protein MMC33_009557, partial [Icmadophila ericetorum]|nr:hypothetical protein [Icmadophila ericetorum]